MSLTAEQIAACREAYAITDHASRSSQNTRAYHVASALVVSDDEAEALLEAYASNGHRAEPAKKKIAASPLDATLKTTNAAALKATKIRWIWDRRFAAAMLNVLFGPPGSGKSTLLYDRAAAVSREGGVVLIATAEDHLTAVVRPRLEAAGADLSRIEIVTDDFSLPGDIEKLEAKAKAIGASLIIIDPIVAFFDGKIDSHRDASIRQALRPLSEMAERLGAAVIVVLHTNKMASGDPLMRMSGSVGFTGAARQVVLAAPDPSDETGRRRILAVTKSNLSEYPPPIAYEIQSASVESAEGAIGTSRIVWGSEIPDFDPQVLLEAPDRELASQADDAAEFLRQSGVLKDARPSKELIREGEQNGIRGFALQRARKALGIPTWKDGFGAGAPWMWGPRPKDDSRIDDTTYHSTTSSMSSSLRPGKTDTLSLIDNERVIEPPPIAASSLVRTSFTAEQEADAEEFFSVAAWRESLDEEKFEGSARRLDAIAKGGKR